MNPSEKPVTMGELERALDAQDQRFQGRLDTMEQRLHDYVAEAIRELETRLLQAFYGYTNTNDRRIEQTETSTAALTSRVSFLEGRVTELEKRLNMPPSP